MSNQALGFMLLPDDVNLFPNGGTGKPSSRVGASSAREVKARELGRAG